MPTGEMVARLQRFYGGNPLRWLHEVPIAVLIEMSSVIGKLRAEESLSFVNDAALASGCLSKEDARNHVNRLSRSADMKGQEVIKPTKEMLAQAGIGVRSK